MRLPPVCVVFIAVLLLVSVSIGASDRPAIHILSHDQTLVTTDPSTGYHDFPRNVIFPSDSVSYRRILLHITYECPDNLHCGEWDYIDHVLLRRKLSDSVAIDIELARMISPYGWRFDSTWSFTWQTDITDFGLLLRDTVDIVFRHTGYENPDDRGWLITLDFEIITGEPYVKQYTMDTLWCGQFPYGDPARPIETLLPPLTIGHDSATQARVRIHQTGHGMDSKEICAEFCPKYRELFFDDSLIDRTMIWRECGENPLYPQAGTWIFDRAGWCPGEVVAPSVYDFAIAPGSRHSIDIEMEPYENTADPSAKYVFHSYVLYTSSPLRDYDVSLDDILVPSTKDVFSRLNPACDNAIIRVTNRGSHDVNTMAIMYGVDGYDMELFQWHGHLASQHTVDIILPGPITASGPQHRFMVSITDPNGVTDEYIHDNVMFSNIAPLPRHDCEFILEFRTNREASHNTVALRTDQNEYLLWYPAEYLKAETTYRDTLNLVPGCYQIEVVDTAGDGLNFWYNRDGGHGYLRLLTIDEQLIKQFNSDFGGRINYWFQADRDNTDSPDEAPLLTVFPPRNDGHFNIFFFDNDTTDVAILIKSDSTGQTALEDTIRSAKNYAVGVDISNYPDGRYSITATTRTDTLSTRIRMQKE